LAIVSLMLAQLRLPPRNASRFLIPSSVAMRAGVEPVKANGSL
jgi:hypothetical protein